MLGPYATGRGDVAFRRNGRMSVTPENFWGARSQQVVNWIADYMEGVEKYPVASKVAPGEIRSRLPKSPPNVGDPFEYILADMTRIVLPGITHWQSPNFFGYYPANSSGPSILGDLMSAGLGVQGMLWATSPACTELETHMLDWLVEMLSLPANSPFQLGRRGRDRGLGLQCLTVRAVGGPRAGEPVCHEPYRVAAADDGIRFRPSALLPGKGDDDRRLGHG